MTVRVIGRPFFSYHFNNRRIPFWERGGFVVFNMNLQCFPCS